MKAIRFKEHNVIFAKDQPEYLQLPAHRFDEPGGRIAICWKLSWKERIKILFAGIIWHQVLTFNKSLQPQKLETVKPLFE